MNKLILVILSAVLVGFTQSDALDSTFAEKDVNLKTHTLKTFSIINKKKYLIVFESGLGDGHNPWLVKGIPEPFKSSYDLVLYDRGGYGKSTIDNRDRNINTLRSELEFVINYYGKDKKVILVGHSLGGMIIRDYAVKNPKKVAALLFIDPSHEKDLQMSQPEEDTLCQAFKNYYGDNYGGTREARQIIEDSEYMFGIGAMPDIPVVVITSMQTNEQYDAAGCQEWYNAHELLGEGITDFTHISTTEAGHYIHIDQPALVIQNLQTLLGKLPE